MTVLQSSPATSPSTASLVWALQISLGITYVVAGLTKLTGHPAMVSLFQAVGAGQWLRYAIGATETTGGAFLFTPGFSGVAAIALCPVMVGAMATGVLVPGKSPAPALLCFLGLLVLAWLRRAETMQIVRAVSRR
jgi:uncharacterized membrane protein YphA (DoxX/SURF4 family)